jgi:nickel/cobalt transporter (NicO) family protein
VAHPGRRPDRRGVGGALLARHLRRRRAGAHHHAHEHLHALPDDVPPLSRRGLVLLGASGGLLPSPSAFLVLSTGLFAGRAGFALVLVAAFSVGLAATITAIGIAIVRGRDLALARLVEASRRTRALLAAVPLASAALICLVGVVLVVRGALALT